MNLDHLQLKKLTKKHRPGTSWPIEKKIEVVSQYLVLGNAALVAATTGVGHDLIRAWKMQPWWRDLELEIRATQNIKVDSKLSKIIERALEATQDRLENGDFYFDQKTSSIGRKPVNMRDAAKVATDLLTRQSVMREDSGGKSETTPTSVNEQLKLLAKEFASWVNKNKVVEVIDVETIEIKEDEDALYDEREEGLQEGSGEVYEPTGSSEEEGGTEPSESQDGEGGESPQRRREAD